MFAQTFDFKDRIIKIYLITDAATLSSVKVSSNVMLLNNDCLCISQILSITDKFIYFIVSASVAKYVIPLVHNHRCVEYIYICSSDNESKPELLNSHSKVRGNWIDLKSLEIQLNIDVDSNLKPYELQSTSCKSLLSQICSQDSNEKNVNESFVEEKSETIVIATLQCENLELSHSDQTSVIVHNFDDITQYTDFILKESRAVFLIVSVMCTFLLNFQCFRQYEKIQAIYIWSQSHIISTSCLHHPIIRGKFSEVNTLLERLIEDICFYRKIQPYCLSFVTFKAVDISQRVLSQFNDQQNQFLSLYLLSKIIHQMPAITNGPICNNESELQNIKCNARLINTCRIPSFLMDALNIQRCIMNSKTEQFVYPQIVYHADVISAESLRLLQHHSGQIFTSNTYLLSTKNVMSARTVSRHIASTGLNGVLLEIEITQRTLELLDFPEENYILFPIGSTFRISSIDQIPDGVWHVKLNYTNEQELKIIVQQLEYEVDQPLNWLTFGHFLRCFNLVNEAKEYYNIWLRNLPTDHRNRCAIHYHLGLLHAELHEDQDALEQMNQVLQFSQPTIEESIQYEQQPGELGELCNTSINQSTIFGHIADIHYNLKKFDRALEFYGKVLATTIDERYRRQYSYKYNHLRNMLYSRK